MATPAGWYPDPGNPGWLRYWDGVSWSEESLPATPNAPPPPPAYASYEQIPPTPAPVPWWQTWYAIVPGLFFCLPLGLFWLWKRAGLALEIKALVTAATVAFWVIASVISGTAEPDPSETAMEATADPTPSAVVAPEPEPEPVAEVPEVVGLELADAEQDLREAGLEVGQVKRRPSAEPKGTVLAQRIEPGTEVDPGSTVSFVIAAPYPRVPKVVGADQQKAAQQLGDAGFRVRTSSEERTSGVDGSVLRQKPAGGKRAKPNSVVRLIILNLVEPPPPPPEPVPLATNCTPGYSPCLPPASDYDCAGGSGNGPEYAHGPIKVTGSDPYDLDRDGDGVACES